MSRTPRGLLESPTPSNEGAWPESVYSRPETSQSISRLCTTPKETMELESKLESPSSSQYTGSEPLEGWRQYCVVFCLLFGMFLSVLDSSIVATALITISTHFNNFSLSTWIVLAYLLTYMGFAMIFARLSDVLGRKTAVFLAYFILSAFSLGCGLSHSIEQLIVFRAMQGIGGSGLYTMTMVAVPEVVPTSKVGPISGLIGIVLACSGVLGPVLGGVITQYSSWRWVFFINVPCGGFAMILLLIAWPNRPNKVPLTRKNLMDMDPLGALLLLAGSVLLVFALQEAARFQYAWNSAIIIATLTVSGSCWVGFLGWEYFLSYKSKFTMMPIFPLRLVENRVLAAAALNMFFTGFPFFAAVVNLPERFQIVNNNSSVLAGLHLLPLLCSSAVGSAVGGAISTKKNNTSFTAAFGSALQLLGVGLLSTLPSEVEIPSRLYGFEVILGLGIGMAISSCTIMTITETEMKDTAVAQGAIAQLRVLGGAIGLAIGLIIFNVQVHHRLKDALTPQQFIALNHSPTASVNFPKPQRDLVRAVYGSAFNSQMRSFTYITAACFLVTLLSLQRHPTILKQGRPPSSSQEPQDNAHDVND